MTDKKLHGPAFVLSAPNESPSSSRSEVSSEPPSIVFTPAGVINGRWQPEMLTTTCYRCKKMIHKDATDYRRQERRNVRKAPQKVYCSRECRLNPGLYVCPECGGWKAQMALTCKDCYLKDKHVELTCRNCQKPIKRPKSEQNKNVKLHGNTGNAFCNRHCYLAYYRDNPRRKTPLAEPGVCPICRGPVLRKGAKYCSMQCYSLRAQRPDGSFAPYGRGWNQEKRRTRERYKGECAMCAQVKARVQVHHIDHDATNHTAVNLILLCEPCHGFYHQAMSDEVREVLRAFFKEKASGS